MVIDLSNTKSVRRGQLPKNEKLKNLQVGTPWKQILWAKIDQVLYCSLCIPVLMEE